MFRRISILIFASLIISATINAQITPEWTDLVGLTYDEATGNLTKTEGDGWNAGARSWEKIGPNEDGVFSYTVEDLSTEKIIALSSLNSDYTIGSMDYAIMLSGTKVSIYEKGKFRGKFGKFKVGDVFSIERSGNQIIMRKNGRKFRVRPTNPAATLYAEVAIYTSGATLGGFTTTFKKPVDLTFTTQNISCNAAPDGSIDITVTRGKAPYTYLWDDGTITEDRTNLDIGTYTITVTDAAGEYYTKSIEINSDISWMDLQGVALDLATNTIIKTPFTKADPYKIGKASSQNTLNANQDGYVSYITHENTTSRVLALTSEETTQGLKDMEHVFYLEKDQLIIMESGKLIGKFGNFKNGEELKIERIGNQVLYSKEGKVLRKVNVISSKALKAKVELYEEGATFTNITMNFCNLTLMVDYTVTKESPTTLGSVFLQAYGGIPPYSYSWLDGDYAASKDNIESDIYQVTVYDNSYLPVTKNIPVGMEIQVDPSSVIGMTFDNDQFDKTASDGWGNGTATLLNHVTKNNFSGAVMVEVNQLYKEWTFGFRQALDHQAVRYNDYNYGFYVTTDNKVFTYDDQGGLKDWGLIKTGDVLSIEREDLQIVYKKNGVVLRSVDLVADPFKIDFSLYSNMKLGKVTIIKFPFWPKTSATITHPSCNVPNTNSGAINLSVLGGTPPFTYSWIGPNGFTATTEDIAGLEAGSYTVTVTDSWVNPQVSTQTYRVGHKVEWTNVIQSIANDNTLIRTATNDVLSGASSVNLLKPGVDGWAEFVVNSTLDENEIFGLSEVDIDQQINSVEYGINLFKSNTNNGPFVSRLVTVYENGIDKGNPNPATGVKYFTYYNAGDRFKVEKTGTTITYLKNDVVFYTSTVPVVSTKSLIVDASAHLGSNSIIKEAITSFQCPSPCDLQFEFTNVSMYGPSVSPGGIVEYLSDGQFCPNTVVNVLVSPPTGFNINDYELVWSQSAPLIGTNFTCQNPMVCSAITLIPTSTQQHIFKARVDKYQGEPIDYCPLYQVKLTTKCEEEIIEDPNEIIGCCFGNYGAGVYVSETAKLNVYCNLLNELGGITNNTVEKGKFTNYGEISVLLDWIHNAQNPLYTDPYGNTDFFGDNQKMRGNSNTYFHDLRLSGNGIKSIHIDEHATSTIDLTINELATIDHIFYMENDVTGTVTRTNGFISTDGAGYFSRKAQPANQGYFYPMGSSSGVLRYRPLEIGGLDVADEIKVSYRNYDPANDGLTALSPPVLSVNDKYFHKINSTSSPQLTSTMDIKSFYAPNDGAFQSISHWELANPYWEVTPGQGVYTTPLTGPHYQGLYYAETVGVQNFVDEPYALSEAGLVIGTGGWGNGGNNPGSGTSTGCNAQFSFVDNNPQFIFTSGSVVSPTATYSWDFDDGSPLGTGPSIAHQYVTNNTYHVELMVTDGNNVCYAYGDVEVTNATGTPGGSTGGSSPGSSNGCNASFTTNFIDPIVYVNDISTGLTNPSYTWDFGDGTQVSGVSAATHTYITGGPKTITLTINDGNNQCTATSNVTVSNSANPPTGGTSTPGCNALFSYINYDPLVSFTDASTVSGNATYSWDFGDNSATATGQVVTHTYTNGTYNVLLTVTDGSNVCVNNATITITDENGSIPGSSGTSGGSTGNCAASFSYSSNGLQLAVTNTSPVSSGATFFWEFGDGNTATGATANHTYAGIGNYLVKLTVTDGNDQCEAFANVNITSQGTTSGNSTGNCSASFNYSSNALQLAVTNTSAVSAGATFAWDFGDGYTATGATANHTYAGIGNYLVKLTVTDGNDVCITFANVNITGQGTSTGTSSSGCSALFTYTNFDPQVNVYNQATLPANAVVSWDFGDGTQLTGSSASHIYTSNGPFIITQTITDGTNSCATIANVEITNVSGVVVVLNPSGTAPCGSGGNIGQSTTTGPGSGNNSNGSNTSTPNILPCDYVMTITANDNCTKDGEIYFTIDDNMQLTVIEYSTDGGNTRYPLSQEVYTTTPNVPGFNLIATPKTLLENCVNDTKVSMGTTNNDFILNINQTTNDVVEDIMITSPATIQAFRIVGVPGYNPSIVQNNGVATLTATGGVLNLSEGAYEFEVDLGFGSAPTQTIKGQFIAKP